MIKKSPIEIFSDWVDLGKDDGMEKNHSESVNAMLNKIYKKIEEINTENVFHQMYGTIPTKTLKKLVRFHTSYHFNQFELFLKKK